MGRAGRHLAHFRTSCPRPRPQHRFRPCPSRCGPGPRPSGSQRPASTRRRRRAGPRQCTERSGRAGTLRAGGRGGNARNAAGGPRELPRQLLHRVPARLRRGAQRRNRRGRTPAGAAHALEEPADGGDDAESRPRGVGWLCHGDGWTLVTRWRAGPRSPRCRSASVARRFPHWRRASPRTHHFEGCHSWPE